MQLTYTQFYLYVFLIQLVVGIVLGLIPFFLGRKRGKPGLGNWGLLVTIIAGAVSPLGAIIALVVFIWLILKKPSTASEPLSGE